MTNIPQKNKSDGLDMGVLIVGFVIGLLAGGIGALFSAPQSGDATRQQITETGHTLRSRIEAAVPADPVAESMAEGKAAARRRKAELDTNNSIR